MEGSLKTEITEFIKDRLKLPENAIITRGSVQISEKDEVEIIGATSVDFQHFDLSHPEEMISLISSEPRTRRGKKSKKEAEPKGSISHTRAREGEGSNITEAQIKGWKATLWARQNGGLLTKEQISALEGLKGTYARNMTPEQKQQVKDIFDETTPKQF